MSRRWLFIAAAQGRRLSEPVYKALLFKRRFIKAFMDVGNFADLDGVPDQPGPPA